MKIVTGLTTYEAGINTLKKIDTTNLEFQNLVVVPDSFSMQAERLLFDVLGINSTLNIEVVGISRLASKVLKNNNISFERISALEEIFLIYKAIKNSENKFKYFNKCGVELCVKILQIVKQFKACNIKPDMIKNIGDDLLDRKMSDLKMIYQEFQNLLGEKLDLSKLLDLFVEKSKKELNLSKFRLFFINFDSFSSEINSFICKLAKVVDEVYIGFAKPEIQSNSFIYEDDILRKTIAFAKENQENVEVEKNSTNLTGETLSMAKNLFAFKVEEGKSDFFVHLVPKNKQEEVEFVAKFIKYQTFLGKKYKDFSVAVSDESYYEKLKTALSDYGIVFYSDDAVDLTQTVLGRFVLKCLNFAKIGLDKEGFEYLLSNELTLTEKSSEFLKKVFYLNVQEVEEFLTLCPSYRELVNLIRKLKNNSTIKDFVETLKLILQKVEENYQKILLKIRDNGLFKKESENKQAQELLMQTFEKLSELGQSEIFELKDFETLLRFVMVNIKVETIPTYIDAVYIGDATSSYFEDVETLFVLGANELPKTRSDSGLIDDNDIKKLKFVLEPEIKVLNRRNRLKLFELLQHAKQRLVVSTPLNSETKQSKNFVEDLSIMFGKNIIRPFMFEEFNVPSVSEEEKVENLLLSIGNDLQGTYSRLRAKDKLPKKYYSALNELVGKLPKEKDLFISEKNIKSLENFSPSQLENYFSCPFSHFLNYGLKIKKKENIEPNKRLFGIFQHCLLKVFVESFKDLSKVENKDIGVFLENNLIAIAKTVYDNKILKSKSFVGYLFNESKIILKNIVEEQRYSSFRPQFLEKRIVFDFDAKHKMVGVVDRVDRVGDYFRVIDYKTGKTQALKKDLYFGRKLQLFLYANAIKQTTKLNCAGMYYFDCQTKYSKINQTGVVLNGMTKKDNEVVLFTDKRLNVSGVRSSLIGMSQKVSAKDGEFYFKNGNTEEDFEIYFDYAKKVVLKAIAEIESGEIAPKPLKGSCEACPYLSICRYRDSMGYRSKDVLKGELFNGEV
ncbi:MAG: hypothetical protein E7375_02740 [Clostridiales bacterium]|nr:hypothetical protein [Clostridiales bacterium]